MNPTAIPWADFTWNPTTGCTFGCEWCYARKVATRFRSSSVRGSWHRSTDLSQAADYFLAAQGDAFPVSFNPTVYPHRLDEPLKRKKPAVIFLGSMGDVFDPAIPDSFRDRIFATVAAAHWHTFVVLTKRAEEMMRYFLVSPIPNLVLGVSVTNQADADERIPLLLDTATRPMVSVEPMLGPMVQSSMLWRWDDIDFVAVGGKTPGKPLHEDKGLGTDPAFFTGPSGWVRKLRDQCLEAGVPFHYKHGGKNPELDGVVYDAEVPR